MASSKDSELNFKPLSSGLGFHPFAEGLPYADQNQKLPTRALPARPNMVAPKSSITPKTHQPHRSLNSGGSGAVAAGRPIFAKPTSLTPQVKRNLNETFGIKFPTPAAQPSPPVAVLPLVTHYDFSYCLKRAIAYLLDSGINFLVCGLALFVTFWKQHLGLKMLEETGVWVWIGAFLLLFNWALITAQEVLFGTTTGKKVFGLVIFGTPSTILIRSLFFLMSLALGGLGVLWALVHPAKRGWHDIVADIQPEEIAIL